MKLFTLVMVVFGSMASAQAANHWVCTGAHNLKTVSFDAANDEVKNFTVIAPDLDLKEKDIFQQANRSTVVAYDIIDTKAQETIDYTLIIDRSGKTVIVYSQWSTNDNVDFETLKCTVTVSSK